jgi:hypothetical protein
MKLDIIYRCCEAEVVPPFKYIRPDWFDKIKCLNTFLNSVDKNIEFIGEVIFVHDGPKGKLYNNIPKTFKIVDIDYQNNEKCLYETFKIADMLSNNIYFIEDDYLHLQNSIEIISKGVNAFKLVTGYDHLDRYTRSDDLTLGKEYVAFSKKTNRHWRTAESTCCSWACTRTIWESTIKQYVYKYGLNDRDLFRSLYKEKDIRLWTPIPGVITQVDQNMSPGIDWKNL